eukprot:CAMPEP_0178414272 /NCGR_PEP_ID=MMETSP0689_2-20121128/22952_1 /TAXON_ID=160604 /ORGANISM="Amphidinium massartii, Strain CS-259" /LENGTH=592 /DNA_ID=CAMNT_0020035559 /DNA_START=52 /DNA_END=1827 /DNA_ORIENTATION=-
MAFPDENAPPSCENILPPCMNRKIARSISSPAGEGARATSATPGSTQAPSSSDSRLFQSERACSTPASTARSGVSQTSNLLRGANKELAEKLFTRRCLVERLDRPELYDLTLDDSNGCGRKARPRTRPRAKAVAEVTEAHSPERSRLSGANLSTCDETRKRAPDAKDTMSTMQDESDIHLDSWSLSPWKDNITPSTASPLSRAARCDEVTISAVSESGHGQGLVSSSSHSDVEAMVKESVEQLTSWFSDELLALHRSLDVRMTQVEHVLGNDCATLLENQAILAEKVEQLQAGLDEQMTMLEDFDLNHPAGVEPSLLAAVEADVKSLSTRFTEEEGSVSLQFDVLRSGFDSHRENIDMLQKQVDTLLASHKEPGAAAKVKLPDVPSEAAPDKFARKLAECDTKCTEIQQQLQEVQSQLLAKVESSAFAEGLREVDQRLHAIDAQLPQEELLKLAEASGDLTARLATLEAEWSSLQSSSGVNATRCFETEASKGPPLQASRHSSVSLAEVEPALLKQESYMHDLFLWLRQMHERMEKAHETQMWLLQVVCQIAEQGFPSLLRSCRTKLAAMSPQQDLSRTHRKEDFFHALDVP